MLLHWITYILFILLKYYFFTLYWENVLEKIIGKILRKRENK